MEIILSCDLIKTADCKTTKPAVDEVSDGGKTEADSYADNKRSIGRTRQNFCVKVIVDMLFRPTDPFHWTN